LLIGFSGSAFADSEIFKIDITAEGNCDYVLSGTDRNGSVSGNDPTVTFNIGDTIIFDIDASRHPFYIKTEFSRGSGDQITTGKLSGTPRTQNRTLSWNIKDLFRSNYYYVCSPYAPFGMGGSIIIK